MAAAPKDLKAKFEAAAAAAKQTKKRPDNATLLKLYSYYKQATDGDVKGDRPGGFRGEPWRPTSPMAERRAGSSGLIRRFLL